MIRKISTPYEAFIVEIFERDDYYCKNCTEGAKCNGAVVKFLIPHVLEFKCCARTKTRAELEKIMKKNESTWFSRESIDAYKNEVEKEGV